MADLLFGGSLIDPLGRKPKTIDSCGDSTRPMRQGPYVARYYRNYWIGKKFSSKTFKSMV